MRLAPSLLIPGALVVCGAVWWTQGATDSPSSDSEATERATVVRVVDGDTLVVNDSTRVRVLGIDSPEEARDGRDPECGAIEATAAARNLLDGQDVDLIADDSQADADTYGRILRYVELDDGRDVGQELLRDGLATVYTPAGAIARQDAYDAAESDAREHGRGVSAC